MRNIRIYIKDISEAMKAAQLFVEGMDFETFIVDDKTSSAVPVSYTHLPSPRD